MQTDPYLMVEKVFIYYRKQINFLEEYYTKKIGYKVKIRLDKHAETSYFSLHGQSIVISEKELNRYLVIKCRNYSIHYFIHLSYMK